MKNMPHKTPTPLRVLILEDRPEDAELMVHELRRSGFDPSWRRAETESDYVAQLQIPPDVVLADYNMPRNASPARAGALARTSSRRPIHRRLRRHR